MTILRAVDLNKKFGQYQALNGISFALGKGEILGILGPNGAGKTTTIQLLLGILTPTSGQVYYFGKKLDEHREEIMEHVNFSSTYTNMPWILTVKECLTFISYLYTIPDRKKKIEELVATFKLEDLLSKQISDLSAGQITRVNLAKSFINSPKVLLLDEPTASLDPEVASYVREFILKQRKESGLSIIITSHNMAEVEEICDRVLFLDKGKIIANDTPKNLAKTVDFARVEFLITQNLSALKVYCAENKLEFLLKRDNRIIVMVPEEKISGLLADLHTQKIQFSEISIEKASLEDYFLKVANRQETEKI